jgi:integrase/recombinase XerC
MIESETAHPSQTKPLQTEPQQTKPLQTEPPQTEPPQTPSPQATPLVIAAQWSDYLLLGQSRSPETITAYLSDFHHFYDFLQKYIGRAASVEDICQIDSQCWRAWLSQQKKDGLCARTMSRRLSALKNFFKFLIKKKYLEDHPIFSARMPKLRKSLPHPESYEIIMALAGACSSIPGEPWVFQRDKSLILLMYSTGLRISEALSVTYEDITRGDNFLTIKGKGGKTRSVPVLERVIKEILDYVASCPYSCAKGGIFLGQKGGPLSPHVFEARIRVLRRMLNFSESLTPHALRHSCATHLLENSDDLRGIQELLGHASLSTTQIYTDVSQKTTKSAYDAAHPRAKKTGP